MELLQWLKFQETKLNTSYYIAKMSKDSFSLMELIFINGIATVHSRTSTLVFLKPFALFALRPYSAAKHILELRGSVSHLCYWEIHVAPMRQGLHPVVSCSQIALGVAFWANSSVADHSKSWQADKLEADPRALPPLFKGDLPHIYHMHWDSLLVFAFQL